MRETATQPKLDLVVIGNGMAGVRTLEHVLEAEPERYNVTVFGAEPHASYNRIMLSPVLAGDKAFEEIETHGRDWYDDHGIALYTGEAVVVVPVCLLYTSPSPRDLSTSRMPSSA